MWVWYVVRGTNDKSVSNIKYKVYSISKDNWVGWGLCVHLETIAHTQQHRTHSLSIN